MNQENNVNKIAIFEGKKVRRIIHNNKWWFVIVDIISVLTDSEQPTGYIKDMRRRDEELSKGWGQIATPLPIDTLGGRQKLSYRQFVDNCAAQQLPSPH